MLNPLLEESVRVSGGSAMCGSGGRRRTVNTSPLACYRVSRAQPLVQQADILDAALNIPVGVAVFIGTCRSLVEDLWEVASAVDDDAEALLHDVLRKHPLELVSMLCRLVKWDGRIEKAGPENIMVDDNSANRSSKKSCYHALPRARRTRHLDEKLV